MPDTHIPSYLCDRGTTLVHYLQRFLCSDTGQLSSLGCQRVDVNCFELSGVGQRIPDGILKLSMHCKSSLWPRTHQVQFFDNDGKPFQVFKLDTNVIQCLRRDKQAISTGDRPPFTDPVLVEYIVVPCPMYQHFPGQEQVEFFQNVPNNVTSTFQLSTLWEHCGNIQKVLDHVTKMSPISNHPSTL